MANSSSGSRLGSVQEYVVRVPKGIKKKHSIMKFNVMNKIDIASWNEVKMERENNVAAFKTELDEAPKFGAGSVYNSEQKEMARKKKHGIAVRNYNPDEQPWHLRLGGKTGKKYRGVREGGILDNASFYVFTEAPDGAFEAFPVEEWYNFSPVARYKTLNAEEAEEEFGRRDKVLNYFSIMLKKRLKNEDNEGDGENSMDGKAKARLYNDFKISEMDDWTDASDNEDSGADSETEKKPKKKTKKKAPLKEKRKKRGTDDEAEEESDEFDEGQEVDYISDDTSSSEEEGDKDQKKQKDDMKGVEDEEALRIFDLSEDEEEEEKEDKEDENADDKSKDKNSKDSKFKKTANKKDSSSDSSSDSSDSDKIDSDFKSAMFIQKANQSKNGSDNSTSSSRANTPTSQLSTNSKDSKSSQKKGSAKKMKPTGGLKRKSPEDSTDSPNIPAKKSKSDPSNMSGEGLNDESIRRYLMRKPITAAELLQKFKSKRSGMSRDQLATTIAAILKRLNPSKQTIKGKIYWSLKE